MNYSKLLSFDETTIHETNKIILRYVSSFLDRNIRFDADNFCYVNGIIYHYNETEDEMKLYIQCVDSPQYFIEVGILEYASYLDIETFNLHDFTMGFMIYDTKYKKDKLYINVGTDIDIYKPIIE